MLHFRNLIAKHVNINRNYIFLKNPNFIKSGHNGTVFQEHVNMAKVVQTDQSAVFLFGQLHIFVEVGGRTVH